MTACDLDEVDIKDQEGNAVQVEGKGVKKTITGPDGAQYTVKPGGTIVDKDGNKLKRDGTIIQSDGSRVNIYGDGTKTKLKVEEVTLNQDGNKVIVHDDGSKTIIKPDGSVERVFKDGTKTSLKTEQPGGGDKPEGEPKAPESSAG